MTTQQRHENEETQARNEVAVLDAIARLGCGTAKEIARAAGLTYNATCLALHRQKNFCVAQETGGWRMLEEPGDGNPAPIPGVHDLRLMAFEIYLKANKIPAKNYFLDKAKKNYFYVLEKKAVDLAIGDLVNLSTSHSGQLINRNITGKKIKQRFTDLEYKHGANPMVITVKNDAIFDVYIKIPKSTLEQWRIKYVSQS